MLILPRYDVVLRSGQSRANVDVSEMRWMLEPREDMPYVRQFHTALFQKGSSRFGDKLTGFVVSTCPF